MTDMRIGGPVQPVISQPETADVKGAGPGQPTAEIYDPEAAPKDYAARDRPAGDPYANLSTEELRDLVERLLMEYALGQVVKTIAEGTDAAVAKDDRDERVGAIAATAASAPAGAIAAYLTIAGVDSALVDSLASSLQSAGGKPLDQLLREAEQAMDRLGIAPNPGLDDILDQVTGLQGQLGEAVRTSLTLLAHQIDHPGQIDPAILAIASGTLHAAAAELIARDPEAARELAGILTQRLGGGVVALTEAEAALRDRVQA